MFLQFSLYKMAEMKLVLFVAWIWIGSSAGHEFFSSMDQVMQLVEEERNLLKLFSSYIKTEEKALKTLKSEYVKLNINSEDLERTMDDSVVVYKLIRRLRIRWLSILQSSQIRFYREYQEWLQSDSPEFPSEEDLEGAALGVIRLQEIHKLYPNDITKEMPLSEDEAFYLGKVAYQEKKFQHAFQWFLYSLEILNNPESVHSIEGVTPKQVQEYLGSSAYYYGSLSVPTDFNRPLLSQEKIMQFVKTVRNLLKLFRHYIAEEEKNLRFLQSDFQTLKLLSSSEDPERIMSNPIAAYRLIWRLGEDWLSVLQFTHISHYKDYQNWLHSDSNKFPSQKDLVGAALGLIRLQEIYKLYPEDIVKEIPLRVNEALYVGLVAYNHDNFQHAFHWFLYSQKLHNHPEILLSTERDTKHDYLFYLGYSAYYFNSPSVAEDFFQKLLILDPTNENVRNELMEINRMNTTSEYDIFTLNRTSSDRYEALCRGEIEQTTSRKQRALSCRYSTGGGNPRLILAPLKEEIEWNEPQIIRYHDIISDEEIEILKNLARPQLSRSEVQTTKGEGEVSNNRVSQSVFLEEDDIVVYRVNQRIADATGLSLETAELLHVQNYGIGGRFEPHEDALDEEDDRIATFLTYMSDVEMGGATVFPKIGVALKPKKGSAVFWFNLHKNGTKDSQTEHAGCPVLLGNKWVANKWIHEFWQEFTRPCSLSELE